MTQIQAIETEYAGCRFRSRTEAKWAVFFDAAAIQWEYEPEGMQLPSGTSYLPDFWLEEHQAIIEVKGQMDAREPKWRELHDTLMADYSPMATNRERRSWPGGKLPKRTFMVSSLPRFKWTETTPDTPWQTGSTTEMDLGWCGFMLGPGSPHSGWAFGECHTCGDFRIGHVAIETSLGCHEDIVDPVVPRVERALKEARSKRFEHGERSVW